MNKYALTGLIVLGLLSVGCEVEGTWESAGLEPEVARQTYTLVNRELSTKPFTKATLSLTEGNNYFATVYYGDDVVETIGKYELNKDEKTITLIDSMGKVVKYDFEFENNDTLFLTKRAEGTDVKLKLRRVDNM